MFLFCSITIGSAQGEFTHGINVANSKLRGCYKISLENEYFKFCIEQKNQSLHYN